MLNVSVQVSRFTASAASRKMCMSTLFIRTVSSEVFKRCPNTLSGLPLTKKTVCIRPTMLHGRDGDGVTEVLKTVFATSVNHKDRREALVDISVATNAHTHTNTPTDPCPLKSDKSCCYSFRTFQDTSSKRLPRAGFSATGYNLHYITANMPDNNSSAALK